MNAHVKTPPASLRERIARVAAVAAQHAADVDAQARFPAETMQALKDEGLLGIQVPAELGGEEAPIAEIAELCSILGQNCGSSAMIFAMHHIKLSSLVEHGMNAAWHRDFMRRIVHEQLLLGSATTEGGIGGDLRNSICAVEVENGVCRLEKNATVISYGLYCDAILITSRAHRDAASSDQVMTVFLNDQYTLEKTNDWDTLGMRGTCSEGFVFKGEAPAAQIIPEPFAEIAAHSMLAMAHLLWSALWYGIAVDAVNRAQSFVRAAARKTPGQTPPGALRLAEISGRLQAIRTDIAHGIRQYEDIRRNPDSLTMGFLIAMNNTKLATSTAIIDIIGQTLLINGIMGYKNGTPYSVGRHLRDAYSAQLQISNERILMNQSTMLLVNRQDTSLLG
ncbi:acyl-CoA/acyl-ACP dehydrogenase [Rhizobiaceae bacterium BDR2-2]|uniref:Acyl-CoA/acyl-ACP dehydrogenase n=1 Tax=Ectorhizobium quercum TaxID=2965071 RepID=A0AAE3N3P6_9HYPH|nr:acyl-CoA dehydrogenase family protein [Ectorhizobium quercum]MCX8999621.1 acyl-CoA/acyl-ACP dehydrogenase [Ectorhizobium quercum]